MATGLEDKDKELDKDVGSDKENDKVKVIIEGEDDDEDRRLVRGDSEDTGDDEDPEARRKKNQEARRKRKEKHRQLWERNRQLETMVGGYQETINQLNARLSKIEEGSVEGYGRRIDQSLAGAERALENAKLRLKKAIADQDADGMVSANEEIAQITVDRREIEASKARFEESKVKTRDKDRDDDRGGQDEPDERKARAVMEQTILRNANIFMRRNPWYDHDDDSDDIETVKRLDKEVAAEGYNPASKDYWEELETRMKEELPHRFKKANGNGHDKDKDDDDGGERRNGKDRTMITGGSGRSARSGNGDGSYRLSKDRVDAIKEAGMWDDPKERQRMIEKYREYDRSHAKN